MSMFNRAIRLLKGPDKLASRERRKLKRVACHQTFVCTKGEHSVSIYVVDVGFGGFKVVSAEALGQRGDFLHLRRVATDFKRHLTGAYTTGLMVRVAWVKACQGGYETGLYLPEAPGSMRISWFKELLAEMGFDEKTMFTQRNTRRHLCRLPGQLSLDDRSVLSGLLLDLSPGGGLFGSSRPANVGATADVSVRWGVKELHLPSTIVGVRANNVDDAGPRWLHSIKFEEKLNKEQERVLYHWLEELGRNG